MTDLETTYQPPAAAKNRVPPASHIRGGSARWRSRFTVFVMIIAAVGAGVFGARAKLHNAAAAHATLSIGTVTLTAQPEPVVASAAGRVIQVVVRAQQQVAAGALLGTLLVPERTPTGKSVSVSTSVRAPTAGIVADDPIAVGNSLTAGQTFALLYDPAALTFQTDVAQQDLPKLRHGMHAILRAPGLGRAVVATVDRVVPRVGANQSEVAADRLELVLLPVTPSAVALLTPGMQFTGEIDLAGGARRGPTLLERK